MSISDKNDLASAFNDKAARQLPETEFFADLKNRFDVPTAVMVAEFFKRMELPAPQNKAEFLSSTDGALVFLNNYGLVIRIETPTTFAGGEYEGVRVDDNAWVLKPLASFKAGKSVIEICPGGYQSQGAQYNEALRDSLKEQGLHFWDYKFSNIGLIPVKTVNFPRGIHVVIDRLAVAKLSESVAPVREALKALHDEAAAAVENFYAPMRKGLSDAWSDPKKVGEFWALCQKGVKEGKLVPGWNAPVEDEVYYERCDHGNNDKIYAAKKAAEAYATRMVLAAREPPPGIMKKFFNFLKKP
ncbi:MAG: hypothetical protein K8R48_06440 [Alphaproteobacteria bacterium]|nr:hypothetical protein [Alphaproteobacteria bacterium]